MTIGMIERMKSMRDEFDNEIIKDGTVVWVEARDAVAKAIAYQTKKQNDAMKKAYQKGERL